ncbi:alpha/beta fold hydrolase [Chloroflexota bacterium]
MKRAYTDIPEGQVHYRSEGTGSPLLLIHQSVCSSDEYSRVIPLLAQNYRVIAMDTLGYGESDKPPRVYQIPDYARSVVSFLDSLGIERASVIGHHTGASIALELAAIYPERVDKLVVSGCPVHRGAPVPDFMQPKEIKEDGSHLMRIWETAKSFGPRAPVEINCEITLEYLKAGPRGEEAHQASHFYDIWPKLQLIKCPTLVLSGRKDLFVSEVENITAQIPGSKSLIIDGPGTGPAIIRRRPEAFARAVLDFLLNPDL